MDEGVRPANDRRDLRAMRLFDLGPHEAVIVRCACGSTVEYGNGYLQREYRIPSDTLVFDLQYRLRCKHCNRREGFGISVQDRQAVGTGSQRAPEIVIVEPKV